MKRVVSYAVALAALVLTASSATADEFSEPVYDYYYYSDAAHQNPVGVARGTCDWYGVSSYFEWGTYGAYSDQVQIAWCSNGIWEPL